MIPCWKTLDNVMILAISVANFIVTELSWQPVFFSLASEVNGFALYDNEA